mgnify:CR=1 FL=1
MMDGSTIHYALVSLCIVAGSRDDGRAVFGECAADGERGDGGDEKIVLLLLLLWPAAVSVPSVVVVVAVTTTFDDGMLDSLLCPLP